MSSSSEFEPEEFYGKSNVAPKQTDAQQDEIVVVMRRELNTADARVLCPARGNCLPHLL
jgi:hypothetical protein